MCDMPEMYSFHEPIARKKHRCVECRMPIPVGCRHSVTKGRWDGEFDSFRSHLECAEWFAEILQNNRSDCFSFGELREAAGLDQAKKYVSPEVRSRWAKILWKYRHGRRSRD